MLFHVLTIHNLTVVACWQKQLRWRTRAGSSPGCPSLHRVIAGRTPPRLPPDEAGVAVSLSSHPCCALPLSGEEMHKCQALPRPAPSHPTSPLGKETQVTELGRSHNWTLTSASRGPDLPRDIRGNTPLILPNMKNCLKPTGTTVQWCAWPYFCWECSSLPPQFHHACLMFPFLLCQIQITSYSRQRSVKSSIAHQLKVWQAVQKMEQSKWPAFKTNTFSFTCSLITYSFIA